MSGMMRSWSLIIAFQIGLYVVGAAGQLEPATQNPSKSSADAVTPAGPIVLIRTPVAPFSASGSATFLSGFGSSAPAMLSLELRAFTPGQYQLGIVRESDQAFVSLAKFSISDPTAGPDRDTTQNTKTTTNGRQSEQLVSHNVMPLARLANPGDIAKLVVADTWGNYLLVGNLHPPKP